MGEIHRVARIPLTDALGRAAGEVLGWSWLYPPYRWNFDARAVEPVRAFALDGNCLRAKCEADHDFGYELVKRFLQQVHMRLERTRLQLLDVYRADR